jgi:hypothetical protein
MMDSGVFVSRGPCGEPQALPLVATAHTDDWRPARCIVVNVNGVAAAFFASPSSYPIYSLNSMFLGTNDGNLTNCEVVQVSAELN